MRVAFVSNYLTHHQKPFCDAMNAMLKGNFTFISTMPIEQERLDMGWEDDFETYEIRRYANETTRKEADELLLDADVAIFGSALDVEECFRQRMRENKLTFRYSERLYKRGKWRALNPKNWRRNWENNLRYINKPLYMLCASGYTAADYALLGAYWNKTFKWGYFPENKMYDMDELMGRKLSVTSSGLKHPFVSILWTGRLIGLKHPDASIELAASLKGKGYSFKMSIIGNGVLEQQLLDMIAEKGLSDCIEMLGAMTPDKVREHMEKADIFLFTSDFNEGWGAVLNESMNSGCAVVASHAIGSVPFLIENGKNGVIYINGDFNSLNRAVSNLLDDMNLCKFIGQKAYLTIRDKWNATEAARRFIALSQSLMAGHPIRYADGPCSNAKRLGNGWFKDEQNSKML